MISQTSIDGAIAILLSQVRDILTEAYEYSHCLVIQALVYTELDKCYRNSVELASISHLYGLAGGPLTGCTLEPTQRSLTMHYSGLDYVHKRRCSWRRCKIHFAKLIAVQPCIRYALVLRHTYHNLPKIIHLTGETHEYRTCCRCTDRR